MEKSVIILLGSPNSNQGRLYSIAKERCLEVLKLIEKQPLSKILLTGGYGAHFNTTNKPHAWYLKQYLLDSGIAEHQFTKFAESTNTLEDASLSKPIVLTHCFSEMIIVTSDYHRARAQYIFEREFADVPGKMSFVGVETDEAMCELDVDELKRHERAALERLKRIN